MTLPLKTSTKTKGANYKCYRWMWNVLISAWVSFNRVRSTRNRRSLLHSRLFQANLWSDNIYDSWHLLVLLLIFKLYNYIFQNYSILFHLSLCFLWIMKYQDLPPFCYNTLLLVRALPGGFTPCSLTGQHQQDTMPRVPPAGLLKSFSPFEKVFKGSGLNRALSMRKARCLPRISKYRF